jgi:hypothetical protein
LRVSGVTTDIAHATAGNAREGCGRTIARRGASGQACLVTTTTIAPLLRLEVGRLRAEHSYDRFDTVVHLGRLGGTHSTCKVYRADLPVLDAGTRADVVALLLEEQCDVEGAPSVWLTRPGEPQVQDEDLAWLSAASRAFGSLGRRLEAFWTVTRTGWLDVRTGECRTWKRLRL